MTENKENVNEKVKEHLSRPSTNIWGWKWSWVSLVVIVISFAFLFLIGPKEGWDSDESAGDGTDSLKIESVD